MGELVRAVVLCPTLDTLKAWETLRSIRRTAGADFWEIINERIARDGFTKSANELLSYLFDDGALGEMSYAIMINDDVRILDHGWLSRMIEVMDADHTFGMASPSGFCRTQPICHGKPGMEPGVMVVRQLPMFCTIMRVKMIRELGLLDEEFIHYGSDSDYCERALRAGWKLLWIKDVFVHNKESPIREEWKEHDRKVFKRKWGW